MKKNMKNITKETLISDTSIIPVLNNSKSIPIEIDPSKTLNINMNIIPDELENLVTLLK